MKKKLQNKGLYNRIMLAKKTGLSMDYIRKIQTGVLVPGKKAAIALEAASGRPAAEWMGLEQHNNKGTK